MIFSPIIQLHLPFDYMYVLCDEAVGRYAREDNLELF